MELIKKCKSLGENSLCAIFFFNNPPSRAALYKPCFYNANFFFLLNFFRVGTFLSTKIPFLVGTYPTQIYSSGTYIEI